MPTLTDDLKNAELWPIKAKGAVTRLNPLGDPTIEKYYHQSLEQGRLLERNIGDAQHWLLQKKKDLMEKITMYTNMNLLAIDGKLSDVPRGVKYVLDSINMLRELNNFQKEIIGLISAVTQNLGILQMMEANIAGMVQQNLNALALTLNQICNWGLPNLPAIPNLFSDTVWHWNGFNFVPLSAFALTAKSVKFDTNFAFNQCSVHLPNLNIFSNYPTTTETYSGLTFGTPIFVPPLGGVIPNTGVTLSDPTFISTMQNTQGAVYLTPILTATIGSNSLAQPFNANNSMQGAVPLPDTIISNYQMPVDVYKSNIVSIVPSLTSQTIEPTDADYDNPNLVVRTPNLQKALAHYVTLGQVVQSNFDPNLTAAWLFYLEATRNGRAGSWIQNFQVDYVLFISPSLTYLSSNSTPWNCVLPSTQINNAPVAIPLITTLTTASATVQGNALWRLSYLEAALLGYTRNTTWDAFSSPEYSSSFTGTDLDYRSTSVDSSVTTTITLGTGTAEYPTPCTFPSAIGEVLQQVILAAALNIQNDPAYVTSRPQFKYIYDQFGIANVVDRFSQFWREFNANLQALLLQDPYLIQFVVSYKDSLASAIDPLGTPTIYNQLKQDVATRNRSWIPGAPLLNIPKAPIVAYSTTGTPASGQSGWSGTSFDPNTFLSRPDIQQLPMSVQIAMLRTNLSYAATQQMGQTMSDAIQSQIQQNQALLQDFMNIGWKAEVSTSVNSIPVEATSLISFDLVDFDFTGNVTSHNTFTINSAGTYAVIVELDWGTGGEGARTGSLLLNGSTLSTYSTTSTQAGPTTIQLSVSQYFNIGDIVTVSASHTLSTAQTVGAGSYISATLTSTTNTSNSTVSIPSSVPTSSFLTFNASVNLASLTAVYTDSSGGVSPIDPTTVVMSGGHPVFPIATGVVIVAATAGTPASVAVSYGSVYNGSNLVTGGLIYAATGGILTQDYSVVIATCQWVAVIGRAISSTQFVYEPHIPQLL